MDQSFKDLYRLSVSLPAIRTKRGQLEHFARELTRNRPGTIVNLDEPLDAVTGEVVFIQAVPFFELSGIGLDKEGTPVLFIQNGDDLRLLLVRTLPLRDVQKVHKVLYPIIEAVNADEFEFLDGDINETLGCRIIDTFDRMF